MKDSRFALSIHILCYLGTQPDKWINSQTLSESINTNPTLIRKELSNLKKNGFIKSKEGKGGGSKLAIFPARILLADILMATKHGHIFNLNRNEPSQSCKVGVKLPRILDSLFDQVDNEVLLLLKRYSLQDLIYKVSNR